MPLSVKSAVLVTSAGLLLYLLVLSATDPRVPGRGMNDSLEATDLHSLLKFPPASLETIAVCRLNMFSADELPGVGDIDIGSTRLGEWSSRVAKETARHRHHFQSKPAEFENSEGFFKMLIMAVVLAEDFGVHYHPQRRLDPASASSSDGFFADSRYVFLHGLLGPERRGTCSSLPVLYVAIGRRLGYPLKLVTTKGHLFVRWEGQGERFNIEAAGNGLSRPTDEEYRKWPYAVTDEEIAAEGYLKSLSPPEELAVFLSIRGFCLRDNARYREAAEAFTAAARFDPSRRQYKKLAAQFTLEADKRETILSKTSP